MVLAYDKRQLLKSAYNYAQAGQWGKALEEYRLSSRIFPEDPYIHLMIADILAKRGERPPAMTAYLEAARLHREQGFDEKEFLALRKALQLKPGDIQASSQLQSNLQRQSAQAAALLKQGKHALAEELLQKLLQADPGNLAFNRLLDEVRVGRMQKEAVQVFQEEEWLAAARGPAMEVTREVMQRLKNTADKYLAAEDFDNAVETLLIMIKIDPSRMDIREQLEKAQERLKKWKQAQSVWQSILNRETTQLDELKRREIRAEELAAWASQEQAVRERLAAEWEIQEEAARQELEIIEKAMREIRGWSGRALAESSAQTPMLTESDQRRLRSLEMEKRQLEERLRLEREEAVAREMLLKEQARVESEKLSHTMELEKMELEARAREAALKVLQEKLEAERIKNERLLEEERQRSVKAKAAMREQLQELIREEMRCFREELAQQNTAELKQKLAELKQNWNEELLQRQRLERELKERESESLRRLQHEKDREEAAKRAAEERAGKERDTILKLKTEEETRKQALVKEALRRRAISAGASGVDLQQDVLLSSRKISDALHQSAIKHMEQDLHQMLESARHYLDQNLLLDAMRICQKIVALDPESQQVKELLKQIYVKKGL